ncbi:hypothetical protein D9V41_02305 [Aeromicrobium phragmitis]|uniref:Uncharacterized protein n=1 Tax=Aeromicrobium phragmitis TaxID=2478914 RepID=A0A3L8PQ42_9ACTN|nr:hypothetical protein [Aeromicrobium phragmitis]RLV57481.1 hypothetical protein D9V41_02305 [Aeromicrobium phragmitis]
MRTLASVFCWIVAVVAGTVALPVTWIADNVTDESGYVALVAELRDDQELRVAVAEIVATDLTENLGLPDGVRDQFAQQLRAAFERVGEIEGFDAAWDETQRRSHALWFDGHRPPEELQLDVAPLAALAVGPVAAQFPVELATPDQMLVTVASAPPGMDWVESAPTWKMISLIAAGAATFLCFVFARRRSVGLAWIGVGALLVAGISYAGSRVAVPAALDRMEEGASAFGQVLTETLADRFQASLDEWIELLAIAGAAALVVGVLARLIAGRREAARRR